MAVPTEFIAIATGSGPELGGVRATSPDVRAGNEPPGLQVFVLG